MTSTLHRRTRWIRWGYTLLACAAIGTPRDAEAQFQGVESATMRLIYTSPLQSYLVPQVAGSFENALRFHRQLFEYDPKGRINILMHDLWHYGNAGARPVPENHVTVGLAPYGHEYESAPAPERMASSMNHELAHIVTTDKATASDAFYRRMFFGKVTPNKEAPLSMFYSYLTTPRWYAPRWYLEGIATYLETWMNGGLGRALGPYDEMVFRTIVRDSGLIYDVVGLESEGTTVDFQVGVNSYLYGTRFMSYLALRYGNDSLLSWVNRREGSRRYFSTQFRQVYGRSLEEEWSRWILWEHAWQRGNLASIREHPTTAARPLTEQVLGAVSRAYLDSATRSMIVAVRYPGQEAHIARVDIATGAFTRISELVGAGGLSVTSLAFDERTRTLFFTTNNSDWRHLRALDLETGRERMLIRDSRIGDLAFNAADRSLWGVRHDNGFSTLVRVEYPYTEWRQVRTLPYGRDLFDLDIAPDGSALIGSMSEISGDTRLVRMEIPALLAGDTTTAHLFEFEEWAPSNFVFSRDGKFLFGSSYYSGVSNIFRYDLTAKRMQPLSNAETGFFKPLPFTADSLIVFAYSRQGFVPSMIPNAVPDSISAIGFLGNEIAERRPEVQNWMPPALSELGLSTEMKPRPYLARRNFKLDNAYPVVEGYQDALGSNAVAAGMRFNFSDRLGATNLEFTASYSPDERLDPYERTHLRAVFRHWNWKLSGSLNRADFYDLFGPTKSSRRGYSVAAQYTGNLFLDGPTSFGYSLQAAHNGNLAILPEFQNVATAFENLSSFAGELNYESFRKSLGAIDDEVGASWNAAVRSNLVNGELYPRLSLDAAKGFLLPLDHSSIWFRASAGSALAGDRTQPFARFFFGGFANNWVDHRDIKQFRATESFPGLEISEVGGATYTKAQVEWMSPPLRFQSVGIPSAYLRWASLSLFASGLITDVSESPLRRSFTSLGAQIDLRLVTLSHLDSTISLGYAVADSDGVPLSSAFMLSFKIM
ncbi:MAG: YncE family protein [Gemmatimonadaceae bacterium]